MDNYIAQPHLVEERDQWWSSDSVVEAQIDHRICKT